MTTLRQLLWELIEEVDKATPPLALGCLADRCRDYLNDHPEQHPTEEELNALWNEVWSDPNRMRYMHIIYAQQVLDKWGNK
jgi:hypothetical protein